MSDCKKPFIVTGEQRLSVGVDGVSSITLFNFAVRFGSVMCYYNNENHDKVELTVKRLGEDAFEFSSLVKTVSSDNTTTELEQRVQYSELIDATDALVAFVLEHPASTD